MRGEMLAVFRSAKPSEPRKSSIQLLAQSVPVARLDYPNAEGQDTRPDQSLRNAVKVPAKEADQLGYGKTEACDHPIRQAGEGQDGAEREGFFPFRPVQGII